MQFWSVRYLFPNQAESPGGELKVVAKNDATDAVAAAKKYLEAKYPGKYAIDCVERGYSVDVISDELLNELTN